jgi:hypothetical protein
MDSFSFVRVERSKHRKAKPTAADVKAAKRLRAIWERAPKNERKSQTELADAWVKTWPGESMTQGALSQYMGGHLPLSAGTVLRFSLLLDCNPLDIRDDLPELARAPRSIVPIGVDYFARRLSDLWDELTDETKGQILAFALVNAVTKAAPKKA